jgi:uncharacterized protein (DUF1499 family)
MTAPAAASTGSPARRQGLPLIVALGAFVAAGGALLLVVSGFGYRAGAWSLHVAFLLLRIGAWIALAGGVLSLLAAILTRPGQGRRGFVMSVVSVLLGLAAFGTVARWRMVASGAPPIHDITTDFDTPPAFVVVLPLRAGAPNPPDYGGAAVAAQQRAAYSDIGPLFLSVVPGATFRIALATARDMGWAIDGADSTAGRIEATATTPWFGFKDDVVVRVTPAPQGGSRVDVRSVSRVGTGDVGTNARRIREYLARLSRTV